jgi:hypothetical protein
MVQSYTNSCGYESNSHAGGHSGRWSNRLLHLATILWTNHMLTRYSVSRRSVETHGVRRRALHVRFVGAVADQTLTEHCHVMAHTLPRRFCVHFAKHRLPYACLSSVLFARWFERRWLGLFGSFSECPTDSGTGYSRLVVVEIMWTYVCRLSYHYFSRLNRI